MFFHRPEILPAGAMIGRGGNGEVYLGHDNNGALIAIKVAMSGLLAMNVSFLWIRYTCEMSCSQLHLCQHYRPLGAPD